MHMHNRPGPGTSATSSWPLAKRNLGTDGKVNCPSPVFFWFGNGDAGHFGSQCGYLGQAVLDFLDRRWRGLPVAPDQRPDRCLHADHRCFHPVGEPSWVSVRWFLLLLPGYLPAREWQPEFVRREHSKLFCCPEAAFLFARQAVAAGDLLQVRLVEGREGDGRSESPDEFERRFYGLEPCWSLNQEDR